MGEGPSWSVSQFCRLLVVIAIAFYSFLMKRSGWPKQFLDALKCFKPKGTRDNRAFHAWIELGTGNLGRVTVLSLSPVPRSQPSGRHLLGQAAASRCWPGHVSAPPLKRYRAPGALPLCRSAEQWRVVTWWLPCIKAVAATRGRWVGFHRLVCSGSVGWIMSPPPPAAASEG